MTTRIREHALRPDVRARQLVDRLRRRAQRQHEERGVPVEGDEIARVDLPREREARAEPRDEDDEEARDEHLGGVERGLGESDPNACLAHLLRAGAVAVEERLLASDSSQHAQPGRGVGAERGQLADLLALHGLARLERLDHEAHQQDEHGHAEQDDEPEHDGGGEQDDRDDDVRDDRAGEPSGDVEGAARAHGVVRDGGDDLARRVTLLDRRAGARGVVRDDLGHPEGGLQPVGDREAVSHHARGGRRRAEPEQDQRPLHEGLVVAVDDAVLDRLADRGGHERLRDHPDHAEEDASEQGLPLEPRDPEEETQRRPGVRVAGVGEGKLDHGCRCTENYAPEARRLIVPAASAGV